MNDSQMTDEAARRSRNKVLALVAIFFTPLALAFLLYYGGSHFGSGAWRPTGSTNRGDLISPARPLAEVELPGNDGNAFSTKSLHGKWNVVYIGDGGCDARCREALVLMRQTRLALNDDISRVQRVFLTTGNCCDDSYLQAEHQGLLVASVDNSTGRDFLAAFPEAASIDQLGQIYIVDPLGNLMMSYRPDAPQKALLEDLKKLLKLSHIG